MKIERAPINNATGMPFTPTGNISATTVQGAVEELDTEKFSEISATALSDELKAQMFFLSIT